MIKIIALLALLVLGSNVVLSQTSPTLPGIVKTAEHVKTNVFDIQITGITSVEQARSLDATMLSKYGILSAVTNPTTQVCHVEALKKVTEDNLRDVVVRAGFKVAKTFNQ